MSTFKALTLALEDWFTTPLGDLPETLRQRVEQEFLSMPWNQLTVDQRRSFALQLDYQHDPTSRKEQKYWEDFFEHYAHLKKQIAEWEVVATPTADALAQRETRLAELKQELARMDAQQRRARGDYVPAQKRPPDKAPLVRPAPPTRYIAYPKAMHRLTARLAATPEELAAWIWAGPKDGGIAAYLNANELDPPPRFFYATGSDSQDYIAPLMTCWFRADDIDHLEPAERYIIGHALIERWSKRPGLHAVAFIQAKIAESRLLNIHPIYGATHGTFSEHSDFQTLESELFSLSDVEQIEAEDFVEVGPIENPDNLAQPTKRQTGSEHLSVPSDTPAAEKTQGSTPRRDARKLDTQAMYKQWQKAYRTIKKLHPNRADVWYSQHIAKMDIAKKRDAQTIKKHMKS